MADQRGGGIAWTEQTWNPIRGCSRVSDGCRHCYAETVAARFAGRGQPYEGLIRSDGKWNGTVQAVPEHLLDPLRWRWPRMIFVNSMSDLYHEALSLDTIDDVWAVMLLADQHVFQTLTKRAERQRWYLSHGSLVERWVEAIGRIEALAGRKVAGQAEAVRRRLRRDGSVPGHIWVGVSVENAATRVRVTHLSVTPAPLRWVSYEPALGPVEWADAAIDWLVVGGESGPSARPFDLAWASDALRFGERRQVPVFVKQLGDDPMHHGVPLSGFGRAGKDPALWPDFVRVRQWPEPDLRLRMAARMGVRPR